MIKYSPKKYQNEVIRIPASFAYDLRVRGKVPLLITLKIYLFKSILL